MCTIFMMHKDSLAIMELEIYGNNDDHAKRIFLYCGAML